MVTSEKDMLRPLQSTERSPTEERFTSLQPTYEDTVPPENEEDWELDERS